MCDRVYRRTLFVLSRSNRTKRKKEKRDVLHYRIVNPIVPSTDTDRNACLDQSTRPPVHLRKPSPTHATREKKRNSTCSFDVKERKVICDVEREIKKVNRESFHSIAMAEGKEPDFVSMNRRLWDAKVPYHLDSSMYNLAGFLTGTTSLNRIELDLLGDLHGKRVLHLQCHFGLDSLSLVREGAAHVTGVDLSPSAIDKARELAETLGLTDSTRFICCNIYDLPEHLPEEEFDIVFTSYGVVGWLPDLQPWAALIARYLKSNGVFVMVEFHQMLWMFDDDFSRIVESYFNRGSIVVQSQGTYTDRQAPICNSSVEWNHSLTEVFQALLDHQLRIDAVKEFDSSPYDCFANSVRTAEGFYQVKGLEKKIPMLYSVKATKAK